MLNQQGDNPAHPAVPIRGTHTMGISLCHVKMLPPTLLDQGSPHALLQHLYIVDMLRVNEHP